MKKESIKRLYKYSEAMEYLGIKTLKTLNSIIKENKIPTMKIGAEFRLDIKDLENLIEQQKGMN